MEFVAFYIDIIHLSKILRFYSFLVNALTLSRSTI
jgi:hypothetical protein